MASCIRNILTKNLLQLDHFSSSYDEKNVGVFYASQCILKKVSRTVNKQFAKHVFSYFWHISLLYAMGQITWHTLDVACRLGNIVHHCSVD